MAVRCAPARRKSAHAGALCAHLCRPAIRCFTIACCWACGAPLDIKNLVSESGWREAPRLRDMTEIHFGNSTCQVEGEIVPVAEMNMAQGDSVYFEHHVLLWK